MANKNALPNNNETAEAALQRVELANGEAVTLHEMPEEVRNNVPVLPIQARKLMGLVQAGKGQFAIFGESSHVGNVENVLQADTDSPMIHMRMRQDPVAYYIDTAAQRYIPAGRMSQTSDGRLTVGRSTIAHEAQRHDMQIGLGMSREHFTIVQAEDGALSIEDHSKNGTSVLTGIEQDTEHEHYTETPHSLGRTAILPQIEQ